MNDFRSGMTSLSPLEQAGLDTVDRAVPTARVLAGDVAVADLAVPRLEVLPHPRVVVERDELAVAPRVDHVGARPARFATGRVTRRQHREKTVGLDEVGVIGEIHRVGTAGDADTDSGPGGRIFERPEATLKVGEQRQVRRVARGPRRRRVEPRRQLDGGQRFVRCLLAAAADPLRERRVHDARRSAPVALATTAAPWSPRRITVIAG